MKKKISCILVIFMITMSTMGSFAAITFSDVPSGHWAKPFITKMADKKIISGYFDDRTLKVSFKPDKSLTYVESIQMIYNTLKAANKLKTTTGLTSKYAATLNANKIPAWANEAMAYALEYGIVHPDAVKVFVQNGKQVYAKKVDVAVFIGKSLNMKIEALPVLNFVDAETIKTAARPYVDILENNGIVGGDAQNKFNPNSIINRAVMATMCSKTYDLLVTQTSVVIPTTPTSTVSKDYEGTIDFVSTQAKIIIVKDAKGVKKSYTLKATYIKKDERYIAMSDLKQGDTVKLIFNTNGEVQGVEVKAASQSTMISNNEKIVSSVLRDSNVIIVKDLNGKEEVYRIDGNVYIKKNGKNIWLRDVSEGEAVKIVLNMKNELVGIEVVNSITDFDGTVDSINEYNEYYVISVKSTYDLIYKKDFKVYNDTKIKLGHKTVPISILRVGDTVNLKYIGDRATNITIDSKKEEYTGILESQIFFREEPMLKIKTNSNDVLELIVDDNVYIKRDGRRAELKDLIKGDIVTIKTKDNKIIDIYATGRSTNSDDEGTIKVITIGDPSRITIITKNGLECTYDISSTASVEIDGESAKIYDLRPNYQVELEIENNTVTEIETEKIEEKNMITAKIVKVHKEYNVITVKFLNKDTKKNETRSVTVPEDTKIISNDAKTIRLSQLTSNDEVFIEGSYVEDLFVAKKIIMLDE